MSSDVPASHIIGQQRPVFIASEGVTMTCVYFGESEHDVPTSWIDLALAAQTGTREHFDRLAAATGLFGRTTPADATADFIPLASLLDLVNALFVRQWLDLVVRLTETFVCIDSALVIRNLFQRGFFIETHANHIWRIAHACVETDSCPLDCFLDAGANPFVCPKRRLNYDDYIFLLRSPRDRALLVERRKIVSLGWSPDRHCYFRARTRNRIRIFVEMPVMLAAWPVEMRFGLFERIAADELRPPPGPARIVSINDPLFG